MENAGPARLKSELGKLDGDLEPRQVVGIINTYCSATILDKIKEAALNEITGLQLEIESSKRLLKALRRGGEAH